MLDGVCVEEFLDNLRLYLRMMFATEGMSEEERRADGVLIRFKGVINKPIPMSKDLKMKLFLTLGIDILHNVRSRAKDSFIILKV